jgi:ABC-2 type transport system permease protein
MRTVLALLRASLLSAASYRLGFLFSVGALVFSFVPIYYITRAMQPMMATVISTQGDDYFAFTVVGLVVLALVPAAMQSLPSALAGGISNGSLEALLGTPASVPAVLAGLISYELLWSLLRAVLLTVGAIALGVRFSWVGLLPGVFVLGVIVISYLAIGALLGAMVVSFRTTGPLPSAILGATTLLGGTYFPTQVIPTWVAKVSDVGPLTYGLRALRRLWLEAAPWREVASDVLTLCALTLVLVVTGVLALSRALRVARERGTLAQY